jgi:cytochrome c553
MSGKISQRLRPALAVVLVCAAGARPCAGADMALGEYLSAECVTCHQLSGNVTGGIPAIVGLPEKTFVEALEAYKTGKRDNSVMRNIAARLSQDDMAALAAYFAARKH